MVQKLILTNIQYFIFYLVTHTRLYTVKLNVFSFPWFYSNKYKVYIKHCIAPKLIDQVDFCVEWF